MTGAVMPQSHEGSHEHCPHVLSEVVNAVLTPDFRTTRFIQDEQQE